MDLTRVALSVSAVVNVVLMISLVLIPETCVSIIYGMGPLDDETPSGQVAVFLGSGDSAYAAGFAIMTISALVTKNPNTQKLTLTAYGWVCLLSGLYAFLPFPVAFPGPLGRRILFCCQCFLLAILNLVAASRIQLDGYTPIVVAPYDESPYEATPLLDAPIMDTPIME